MTQPLVLLAGLDRIGAIEGIAKLAWTALRISNGSAMEGIEVDRDRGESAQDSARWFLTSCSPPRAWICY